MIFLVVDKEKSMCYGVFNDETIAKRYIGHSDAKIVYLGKREIEQIKELTKKPNQLCK